MPAPPSRAEQLGKQGADFKQALVKAMARAYGERSSNAAPISHERELELYMQPTSPAALEALKMGGTPQDAEEANRMWAVGMRQQQEQMRQAGLAAGTPQEQVDQQIHDAGLSDEAIFQACRQHAFELGKQHSQDDPEKEVQYHDRMATKAQQQRASRMGYTDVTGQASTAGQGAM